MRNFNRLSMRGAALSCAAALALPALACRSEEDSEQPVASAVHGTIDRGHVMPKRGPEFRPASAPANAHLEYFGGPVVANAKVVQVLFGSGQYMTQISGANLGSFYQQVLNSAHVDWLSEYDTTVTAANGKKGTNQHIGRGSFLGRTQIQPSSSRAGTKLTDSQIQSELSQQIASGILPAPDADTIYMINFPKGVSISMGGGKSCQSGGFCAYHSAFKKNGGYVFYGVLPDMSAGSGCDEGCGGAAPFDNQTAVAAHELIEAVTDPAVGLANSAGPPLAWYDESNGEIADICADQQATFQGTDGVIYTVQKEFSNQAGDCIGFKSDVGGPDAGTPDSGPADSGPADAGSTPDAGSAPDAGSGSACCYRASWLRLEQPCPVRFGIGRRA